MLQVAEVATLYEHGDLIEWQDRKDTDALDDYIRDSANAAVHGAIPLDLDVTIDGVRIRCLASNGRTRFDPPRTSAGPRERGDLSRQDSVQTHSRVGWLVLTCSLPTTAGLKRLQGMSGESSHPD